MENHLLIFAQCRSLSLTVVILLTLRTLWNSINAPKEYTEEEVPKIVHDFEDRVDSHRYDPLLHFLGYFCHC